MPDVVIVGGGPAGSATALTLARAGVAVTLVERARFPRRKVCGEYQNCGALAALDELGLRERVASLGSPLVGIRLVVPRAPAVELRFARPAVACDRATLDAVLLDAARDAGVEVVHGRVEALAHDGARIAGVTYRDEAGEPVDVRARYTVGADGAGSVVARKLGLTLPVRGKRRFAVGGHYRGFGTLDAFVEMFVGAGAYVGVNPLDARRANVMVVVADSALERWSADVDAGIGGVAARLAGDRRSFAGAERIGPRVSIGPLAHRVRAPIAPGALLVGDAAGFLNPFTGQGVYLALNGARAAGATLLHALHDRAAATTALDAYAEARVRDFRARALLCRLVTLLIDVSPLARRAASRLQRVPSARRALVDALSGVASPASGMTPAVLCSLLT